MVATRPIFVSLHPSQVWGTHGNPVGGGRPNNRREVLPTYTLRRLAALVDKTPVQFKQMFDRYTLFETEAHYNQWPDIEIARARADELRGQWLGRKVILLGVTVADAFRLERDSYQWFETLEIAPGFECIICPHPTGTNRWWYNPVNVERAREFFATIDVQRAKRIPGWRRSRHGPGKPEKFSLEQMAAALRAARGIPMHAAAILRLELATTCAHSTVIKMIDRYPELQEICEDYKNRLISCALSNIAYAVEVARDPDISLKVLERLSPDWAQRIRNDLTVGRPLPDEAQHALNKLSIDELRLLEGIYAKLEHAPAPDPDDLPPTIDLTPDQPSTDLIPIKALPR